MPIDLFISYASEDRETVARPLANELRQRGWSVWFDKYELTLGDILAQSIDEGLAEARYGLVILSSSFFSKRWPRRELDGLTVREMAHEHKVILPVWHDVDEAYVARFSPPLAGKLAVQSSVGIPAIVDEIERVLRRVAADTEADGRPAGADIVRPPLVTFPDRLGVDGERASAARAARQWRGVRLSAIALATIAAASTSVAGFSLGSENRRTARFVANEVVRVEYEQPWTADQRPSASFDKLRLLSPVQLRRGTEYHLAAGLLTRFRPGGDPVPTAQRALWRGTPVPRRVVIGDYQALVYDGPTRGGGATWLALIPTSKGWLGVACHRIPSTVANSDCRQRAAAVRVVGATPQSLAPQQATARVLAEALGDLNTVRTAAQSGLAARSRQARVEATSNIALAARQALARTRRVSPVLHDRKPLAELNSALAASEIAAKGMSSAARRGVRESYRRATSAMRVADRDISVAIRRLAQLGYRSISSKG